MVSRKNPTIPRRQVVRKTVIQPAFNASLEFLVEYSIGVFGKTVTDKLVAAIMGTLTRISMMPDAAPIDSWKTPERGRTYRIAIVRSYKISYYVTSKTIVVVDIFHESQHK